MKSSFPRLRPLASAVSAVALTIALPASGQTTATTDPVGFITLNVPGTNGTTDAQLSFQGLGLTRPVEYQGSAETVGASSVTDDQANWTDNQFNPPGATLDTATFYLEIASGNNAGSTFDIIATNAATKTITLAQPLPNGTAAPMIFKIRKHWTLASVFGANNEAGLQGGFPTSADQIRVYNGSTYDTYYYSTGGLVGTGWRKVGDNPANTDRANARLYPDDGILLTRKQSEVAKIVLTGSVKTGQSVFPVFGGLNIVANPFASTMTLASSNLHTGDPATGVAAGFPTTADQVRLYNGSTYDTYYYSSGGLVGSGWRKVGDNPANTDRSNAVIPLGTAVLITRQGETGFNWKIPQHPSSL